MKFTSLPTLHPDAVGATVGGVYYTRTAYDALRTPLLLPFEREGYGVNVPGAWRRLYGEAWGYYRDFGWRACFLGGGE